MIILLALKRPGDVPEGPDPVSIVEEARGFENKLQELQEAKLRGDSGVQVQLSAEEINAFLVQSTARRSGESAPPAAKPVSSQTDPAPASGPGEGKDFRVHFDDDVVVAFFVADFYGKNLDVTLSGKPGASNGYLTFSPTGFKIGSLPIPMFLAGGAIQRRLNDPETHEKLKLAEFIGDLRVQNGQLVITER